MLLTVLSPICLIVWDRKPNGPIRKMLIDEMKTFKELSSH